MGQQQSLSEQVEEQLKVEPIEFELDKPVQYTKVIEGYGNDGPARCQINGLVYSVSKARIRNNKISIFITPVRHLKTQGEPAYYNGPRKEIVKRFEAGKAEWSLGHEYHVTVDEMRKVHSLIVYVHDFSKLNLPLASTGEGGPAFEHNYDRKPIIFGAPTVQGNQRFPNTMPRTR